MQKEGNHETFLDRGFFVILWAAPLHAAYRYGAGLEL
jgi:hypothetical protein